MLVDTHCHINMMVKKTFDVLLTADEIRNAREIIEQARTNQVTRIINVGTSLPESINCVALARAYNNVWAAIGIHPNDCTDRWKDDLAELEKKLSEKEHNKIVAIGECGLDMHYPEYNLARQQDAFKYQINMALEHDLALIVHTRDAYDETLRILEEYRGDISRGIIHCFSEDLKFAEMVIEWGFSIGIGGAVTYPKNNTLREVALKTGLEKIVLETDAPFLPIQSMRGKQNHPQYIHDIAQYLSHLKQCSFDEVALITTNNALRIFAIASDV